MKRRSFLQFLGMSPAVAVAPAAVKASEKFEQTAKALEPAPPRSQRFVASDYSDATCASAVCYAWDDGFLERCNKTITIK